MNETTATPSAAERPLPLLRPDGAALFALGPAVPTGLGLFLKGSMLLAIAAIRAAHIGFDRMLGYGLKDTFGFNDTHPGRIGRQPAGT